jgi:hypothetical protein
LHQRLGEVRASLGDVDCIVLLETEYQRLEKQEAAEPTVDDFPLVGYLDEEGEVGGRSYCCGGSVPDLDCDAQDLLLKGANVIA